jgi:GGDEF domain-containing protein
MRLWEALREERFLTAQGLSLALAGSFGLATFPEDGNNVQAIIRAADTMMYAAKTTRDGTGRGQRLRRRPRPGRRGRRHSTDGVGYAGPRCIDSYAC